jgi:hypothetical protein
VGFAIGDTVDLTTLLFSGGSATLTGDVLSVVEGGKTAKIEFASAPAGSFTLSSGTLGGTAVTLVSSGGSLAMLPAHLRAG